MIEPKYKEDAPEEPVRLDPFQKSNWKTKESRDNWQESILKMQSAKHEAEWRSVMDDSTDRKAAIIHIDNYNRERWLRRLSEYDLVFRDIRHSKPYDGFSHKFFPTDENDPERITYSVIAQNEDIADKVEEAELELSGHEKHDTVGKFLGFPECCRNFFNKEWIDSGLIDPMYEVTCNSDNAETIDGDRTNLRVKDPNPGTNVLWRYFGWSFITHMPCSWDCEHSIEVARNRYNVMAENGYKDAADAMAKWLSLPAVWTGYHSIMEIRNRHMMGSSTTSCYWDKKRIVWGEEHQPGGSII